MSQFQTPYDAPPVDQSQLKTSGLAITALVFGILAVIPCLGFLGAPIGLLLSLIGVATISPSKGRKGKGMAMIALVLSVVGAAEHYFLGSYVYRIVSQSVELVEKGPENAMNTAAAGDLAGFKSSFHGLGATATDAEARAFLDTLTNRYGAFVSCELVRQGQPPQQTFGQTTIVMPYVMTFEDATVNAEAELVFQDPNSGAFVFKLGYIRVIDPDLGNVRYPSNGSGGGTAPGNTGGSGGANDQPADADAGDGGGDAGEDGSG